MHSCRTQTTLLQRAFFLVIVSLLCSMLVMPFSWNRIHASADAGESVTDPEQLYAELKSGQRLWKDKAYAAPEQPTVYLTFDDGPSALTSKVLDILRDEEVKATFFVLGEQVKAHPEQLRQTVKEGHAIGNHTYDHVYKELYSDVETFWNQLEQTEQIIKEETGIRTKLVRAPGGTFGNFDAFYFYYLDQAGYEVHDWNIDSGDSKRVGVPASEILQTVEKGPFGKQVILLMHDGTGHEQTVKALPDIIHLFKEKGYAFASLTPEVQPNHFRAGKPSVPRSLSETKFEQLLSEAQRHGELLAAEAGQGETSVARQDGGDEADGKHAEAAGHGPQVNTEPLELTVNGVTYELGPEQYRLKAGHYQIPLRIWAQAAGGEVEWEEARRTAVLHTGQFTVSYDFSRSEQRVSSSVANAVYHLPEMELQAGTVWVPLRKALEQLGGQVTSFGEQEGRGQIDSLLQRAWRFPGWGWNWSDMPTGV